MRPSEHGRPEWLRVGLMGLQFNRIRHARGRPGRIWMLVHLGTADTLLKVSRLCAFVAHVRI